MNKSAVVLSSLALAMAVLGFTGEKKEPDIGVLAYVHANKSTEFARNQYIFNHWANKEIRAKRLAETEAVEVKKQMEETKDKGEGQVKLKF